MRGTEMVRQAAPTRRAELLIDCEEDRVLRVLVGMLRLEPLKAKAANKGRGR
jgi:hypothetical protein